LVVTANVFGLGEGVDFAIPNAFGIDAENQTLINHPETSGSAEN
jgi:hypothetical protein